MKQYCRYCGWLRDLGDGGPWYCEAKDKEIKSIKSANNCKKYGYCGLDEWQQPHTPKEYNGRNKRKVKVDNIALFELGGRMKRIEVMAKMDEQNVADEIITFLREHDLVTKMCSWHDGDRLDAIYGLAQYLGEDVGGVAE